MTDSPQGPPSDPHADARRALEQSEINHSPAIGIAGPPARLDAFVAALDEALTWTLDFRAIEIDGSGPGLRLYRRGGRGRWVGAKLLQILTTQGGMQNVSYHALIERFDADNALFTVHGVRLTLHAPFDPHEVFGPTLSDLAARFPEVRIGAWFDSDTLPPALVSSPAGFARWIGTGRSLSWT